MRGRDVKTGELRTLHLKDGMSAVEIGQYFGYFR